MSYGRRFLVGCVLLCCAVAMVGCGRSLSSSAGGASLPAHESWTDFTTDNGKVSAKFPKAPKQQSQKVNHPLGTLDFTMHMYESGNTAFMVSDVTYPVPPGQYDAAAGLEGACQGAAQNVNGTVVEKTDIEKFGYPGKSLLVRTPENHFVRSEIFIDPQGPTLVQAICVGSRALVDGSDADFFFDSLSIK